MTEEDDILSRAERDLRADGTLSPATCAAYQNIDLRTRGWLDSAFDFLGCGGGRGSDIEAQAVGIHERVAAVRLMLLRLGAQTIDPRWSSAVLERLVAAALMPPESQVADIVRAALDLLGETDGEPTASQAQFARELGIQVVGRQRRRYAEEDFTWLRQTILDGAGAALTPAQAYFAAYVLPPEYIPECAPVLQGTLASTRYAEEIEHLLEE